MRYLLIAVLAVSLLCLTGCFVTSLNPLDDGSKAVSDQSFAGSWSMPCQESFNRTCTAKVTSDGNAYVIAYTDEHGIVVAFKALIVQLGNERYLDVSVKELAEKDSEKIPAVVVAHMAPTHSIWKLSHDSAKLQLVKMSSDAVHKIAGDPAVHLSDPWNDETLPLFLSSTKELQQILQKHGAELFKDNPWIWERAATEAKR
jgi:hypothetical protein